MINLGRLEGFFRVARAQGYARAAREFPYPITQPGVHQQVRKLEEELGVKLFERVGKDRVVLTAAGRLLYGQVAPFLEGLGALEQSIRAGRYGGTLRILAAGLVVRQLMPGWLRRLRTRRPDIDLALSETRADSVGILRSGETDLIVDYLPGKPVDLETRRVATVRGFIAIPDSHPAARRRRPRLADLRGESFISYGADRRQQRELQMRALALHGLSPGRIHTADSSETILGFVASGLGFSVVPSLLRHGPRVPGVTAVALDPPSAELPVYAAWRRGPRDPLVDAALETAPA